MIHVCFCFCDKNGRYAKFAGTSMLSLFENTKSPVTAHILHDNTLTAENRDKFSYIAGRYNQLVNFYNVDELCPNKIAEIKNLVPEVEKSVATVGAFYKLMIPQILPAEIKKVIFLDPDTIVNLDINELWQIELADKILGVIPEMENGANALKAFLLCSEGLVKPEDYFNGGVLLMNLNLLRGEEEKIMQGIEFRGKNPKQKFFEQTVLNYCFSEQTLKLPAKYNRFVREERTQEKPLAEEKIYHYVSGSSRPGLDTTDPFNRLWLNYFIKTPFFDDESFARLYAPLQKIRSNLREIPLNLTEIMPGKKRAFLVDPKKINSTKKLFSIRDDEKIILLENESSIQELIDAMKTSGDEFVFFILTEKFQKKNFPLDRLKNAGFIEDKDFVKAWTFLPEKQTAAFDSYSLVQAM